MDGLVTIWSAPNYCYRCGNVASILQLNEHLDEHFIVYGSAENQETRNAPPSQLSLANTDYFI
jgi:serine/threonine-protein phosphatase 4 catalytic subunit